MSIFNTFYRKVLNIRRNMPLPISKSIKDFGYAFNSEGKLCKVENSIITNQPFQFNISNNHQECQRHYEQLGDAITEHVYNLLITEEKLNRLPVPVEWKDNRGTFIFVSENYDEVDTLVVLIHGSGVVRAGQWARSLIINDSIHSGTQIPYIRKILQNGHGVLLMNSNDNSDVNGKRIPNSSSPEEHSIYVWERYISTCKASNIVIVAHSYGGVLTMLLADTFKDDFKSRVKAIALTDSVHGFSGCEIPDYVNKISRNWVSSNNELDKPITTTDGDVIKVSAGTPKHELTSSSCINSVFAFINEKLLVNN